MKLKILLVTVFAAGLGASFALADDGHGHGHGDGDAKRAKCVEVHLRGTVAAQSLSVVVDRASERAGIAAGSTVALALGGPSTGTTGQTTRVDVEACAVTVGTATQLQVKALELRVRSAEAPRTTTTGTTATTATTATTHTGTTP